ncbi:aminotransferase class V-fold PLP-dependent enzyme [Sneathiella sp. P13V-1]|uniref:aminotransferase class V-fold PLP-dependent enzyme n=1 Tax=Sneathiella sp. P13V-1 TaxID=2697366 RepID=UPI00187B7078|nr:aminotransferase class V-fold PLP-dependent enzyme [Sneathiella sp. P13V-1]MBE7637958.1 aminotransferase class V-fold PLP-dependent enzyme [Sneathiella sp. P13V-1]
MTLDIKKLRQETPGTQHSIHLNNAGSSLMPKPVYDAVVEHLDLEMQIGGYEAHARAMPAFERTYDAVAQMINADRSEIALVENATYAWLMAFHGLNWQKGDRILTAEAEYASNVISYLQMAKNKGVVIDVVPSDEHGQIDVVALEEKIGPDVKLISISHIPTNGGLINPAKEVGAVAKKYNIPYLLDACQSVGQVPIDVEEIGCDMLSATGRKYLRGPRGTGFLYVRKGFLDKLEPPFLDLHSAEWVTKDSYKMREDARRFENWENSVANLIGMGVAADYYMEVGMAEASDRLCSLAATARQSLSQIPGVSVHDLGLHKGGMVTFAHEKRDAVDIKAELFKEHVNVSTSTTSSTRYDMERRALPTLVRASFHYYNDENELDKLVELIKRM